MALHKKFSKLLALDADINVIQECARPFIEQMNRPGAWSSTWFGKNPNKGLGILVRAPWSIREAQKLKPKWAGKLLIDGPERIELFPVWACMGEIHAARYIGQVHCLLDMIEETPLSPHAIVVGDFNSNSIWDDEHGLNHHSAAVDRFGKLGLESAYHVFSGDRQGAERNPTFWFRKNKKTVFHIDYAFLSRPLLSKLKRVLVGRCDDWLSLSDHAPVLVDLDL
jgi:exonuclease III